MRRLGISIYPEKSTLDDIKRYLKKTSECGFSRIFSCLLSVNKPAEEIKKELYDLRVERDIAPFEFEVDGVTYLQNNRSIDQSNLTRIVVMCQALKKATFENWKFYTKENSEKYVNLTIQDMMKMANIMQEQTTKSMAAETLLTHNLENLTDEELKKYNAKEEYEKAYKNM